MGWNLSLVHASGPAATVDGFALANGYRPDVGGVAATFEELLARPDEGDWARPPLAVGDTPTGLLLAAHLIVTHDWAAALSARHGTATWAVWQSDRRAYGFAHYRDGTVRRELQRLDGATTHEEGDALPEESLARWTDPAAAPDDEADLFALVSRLTGLPEPARWLAGPARPFRPAAIGELDPIKKKRRFGR